MCLSVSTSCALEMVEGVEAIKKPDAIMYDVQQKL